MDSKQLEEICNEIEALHKSIKNIIQIVFAISPLLALSTNGWSWKATSGTYLLRVSGIIFVFRKSLTIIKLFVALGNNRPKILVKLEDRVLEAIVAISEGLSPEKVLDNLYSQLVLLENDLSGDVDAMNWFNLFADSFSTPPTPPPSVSHSTPSKG